MLILKQSDEAMALGPAMDLLAVDVTSFQKQGSYFMLAVSAKCMPEVIGSLILLQQLTTTGRHESSAFMNGLGPLASSGQLEIRIKRSSGTAALQLIPNS